MDSDVLPPFVGHCYGGAMLIILGTWYAFGVWRGYVVSRLRRRPYHGTAFFTLRGTRGTICVDGLYKMAAGCFGTANYAWLGISNGHFTETSNAQHMSLFVFYGMSGILDALTANKSPLPEGTDYAGLMMAFSVQALLFHFHLHGRSPMDVLVHTLLVYTTVAAAACVGIEMAFRRSALAALGRAFFTILQGTWLVQIAFILYYPWSGGHSWKDDHQDLMLATAIYTWHMAGIVAALSFVGLLTGIFMRGSPCHK
uniref:Putative transmembrane protein n=1 Tax=Ixodes ricinus TaxID=34613 RepID=A0A147BNT1_IXORI